MKRYNLIFLLLFLFGVNACKQNEQAAVMPIQQIPVVKVKTMDVPIYYEFVGQAYGLQDIPIRARAEGFLEGIHFEEGGTVKKGQLLYTVDPQPLMAEVASYESQVAEAETVLINAQNELERYEPLVKINAVSKSDYDATVARRDAAKASLDAAKSNLKLAKIKLSYTNIVAPIDGIIGKTDARVGEFVGREPNPVILNTVSRIDQMRVEFFVTESNYITLAREYQNKEGYDEETEREDNLQLILSDGSLYSEKGRVNFIDRNVNAMTGSMLVQATFPNPNQILRPGMFTKVKIEAENIENATLIPQRCIMELQGQYSVYAVEPGDTVRSRQIQIGERIGDMVIVHEGLKNDDLIVIDALQKVGSGRKIDPQLTEFKSQAN